jgi:hypothetical protein
MKSHKSFRPTRTTTTGGRESNENKTGKKISNENLKVNSRENSKSQKLVENFCVHISVVVCKENHEWAAVGRGSE